MKSTKSDQRRSEKEAKLKLQNEKLKEKLSSKFNKKSSLNYVDIRELQLNIPQTNHLNPFQMKMIENQIGAYFVSKGALTIPHTYLDGYLGFLTGKYPILFNLEYHGYVSYPLISNLYLTYLFLLILATSKGVGSTLSKKL